MLIIFWILLAFALSNIIVKLIINEYDCLSGAVAAFTTTVLEDSGSIPGSQCTFSEFLSR